MDISKSVQLALNHNEMRATELAAKMGVSNAYISQVINGEKMPSVQKLSAMASITGFSVSKFIALGEEVAA